VSDFENIIVEMLNDKTGLIKINRPKTYNALTREAKLEIIKAIRSLQKESLLRSIILTAEGKAFCSGQDLNDRTVQAGEKPVDLGHTLETEWNPLVMAIRNSRVPVIAAINGVCAGAGLSVAFACDLLVSKPAVKFVSGFSKLGLCPDAGSSYTFTRMLGYQKTLEFFYFNEAITSDFLHEKGIIASIGENEMELARELSEKLAELAPYSIELIKRNAKAALDLSFDESISRETCSQRFLGRSEDYREGLQAFFDKRKPEFGKGALH
jgi:2-(1,2-epoxy-1,2-dihydrophenyl)acetyl-CoA isomerase